MDGQVEMERGVRMTKSCSLLLGDPQTVHTHAHSTAPQEQEGGMHASETWHAHLLTPYLSLTLPASLHLCPCTEIAKNITVWQGMSHVSILATHFLFFLY